MIAYILRRLINIVPIVLIGLTITFFFIHLAPGDPTLRLMDPGVSPEVRQQIIERFGLDQALHIQYYSWLRNVILDFDFGNSFKYGRAASAVVLDALPATLLLTGTAILLGLLLGITSGIVSAVYQGRLPDRLINVILLFFYSMPVFWLGMMALGLFSIKLDLLPASQLSSIYYTDLSPLAKIMDVTRHLILPVTTLGLASAASFGRFIRASIIKELHSDYIMAARGRGLSERKIVLSYAVRNGLIPLISLIGLTIPVMFGGAVVIEVVFSLPGMGRTMVEAVLGRDYPVILSASSWAFISVVIGNLLADIGYALADPRVRINT